MGGKRAHAGFSLIELMVAVSIIGVLAATAIPAFAGMMSRSKAAEVSGNLSNMFKLAASYYASERGAQGHGAALAGYCTVDDAGPIPLQPLPSKQAFVADASFRSLGFGLADYTYFSYGLITPLASSRCANAPSTPALYTFYANGDLDGDSIVSTFELAAGSDSKNVLMHSRGMFVDNQAE